MFGCSLAAVMRSMLVMGLCGRGAILSAPAYPKVHPYLELPTIRYWRSCQRECRIQVSLNRHHQWVFDDGEVAGEDLEKSLARRSSVFEALGYRPSIRVRIAAREPARHFLRLHRAAVSAGIEDFSLAFYRAEAP